MAADEVINFDWDELGEVERGEAVLETLETLFDRLDRHIELTSRQDASNPHVVEYLMQSCLGFVDQIYTGRENTCVDPEAFYENSWEVDHEPVAVPLDMWARGAVAVREKPKLPGPNRTGGSSVLSRASSVKTRKNVPPGIAEEADKSRLRTPSPPSPNKKPPKAKLTKEELDREDRLREELAMRRRRDEINRQMVEAETKALDEVAELKKSLKGKDYSYDHRGQVVIMTKVDGERMPGMLVTPGTAVADAPPPATPSDGRAPRASQSSQGGPVRSKGSAEGSKRGSIDGSGSKPSVDGDEKRGKKLFADTLSMPYVEQPNEGQPPPTETIKPMDGVTLQFGRTMKKGGERKTSGLQDMSKGEYLEYIKKKGSYEKLPFNEAAEFKAKQMQEQKKKERERQQRLRRDAAEASGEKFSRRMSTSSVDSGIGPMGLGVPTADANHPSWMNDGVKVDPKPPKPRTTRRGDINKTMILGSDDWGQNKPVKKGEENEPDPTSPGKRPSRMHATIEHRERTVGRVPRRPRDRSFGYITERDLQEYLPQEE